MIAQQRRARHRGHGLGLAAPRNSCVSVSLSRTHRPSATSTALARNGSRQPQSRNWSSVRNRPSSRQNPLAAMNPTGAPIGGNIPSRLRHPAGPFPTASSDAPPPPPPTPRPPPSPCHHKPPRPHQPPHPRHPHA